MTPCLAGQHCAAYDHLEDQPATTTHPLCPDCLTRAQLAVGALVRDYRDLEQLLPPALGVWGDGQPHGDHGPPIPMRLGVEALQRTIWKVTTTWAEVLAEHQHLADPPARVRDGYAVAWAVRTLTPRLEALTRLPEVELVNYPLAAEDTTTRFRSLELTRLNGAQGVLDLAHLHERARSQLGLTAATRRLPGTCPKPRCGRPELHQDNGSDTVWCAHCGTRMTRDDYEEAANLFRRGGRVRG